MKMREMKAARERRQTVEVSAIQEEIVTGKDHNEEVDESEPKRKKKKESKRKLKHAIENEELVNSVSVSHSFDVKCSAGKRKRNGAVEERKSGLESGCKPSKDRTEEKGKKKKAKEINSQTLEVDSSSLGRLEIAEGVKDKKKTSKRKSEKGIARLENEDLEKSSESERRRNKTTGSFSDEKSFNETISEVEEANDEGNLRKKKKKKKNQDVGNSLETVERMKNEKKKRKKDKKRKI